MVVGLRFERRKAVPADLQSAPVGHFGNPPEVENAAYYAISRPALQAFFHTFCRAGASGRADRRIRSGRAGAKGRGNDVSRAITAGDKRPARGGRRSTTVAQRRQLRHPSLGLGGADSDAGPRAPSTYLGATRPSSNCRARTRGLARRLQPSKPWNIPLAKLPCRCPTSLKHAPRASHTSPSSTDRPAQRQSVLRACSRCHRHTERAGSASGRRWLDRRAYSSSERERARKRRC